MGSGYWISGDIIVKYTQRFQTVFKSRSPFWFKTPTEQHQFMSNEKTNFILKDHKQAKILQFLGTIHWLPKSTSAPHIVQDLQIIPRWIRLLTQSHNFPK